MWLTGTLSSLCALVSLCIASKRSFNKSWFHYHPQLSIRESEACLSARLSVCVHAPARVLTCQMIGCEPPKSSKDHCRFATSVTLMYRHTRSQRSGNLLDWNVVSEKSPVASISHAQLVATQKLTLTHAFHECISENKTNSSILICYYETFFNVSVKLHFLSLNSSRNLLWLTVWLPASFSERVTGKIQDAGSSIISSQAHLKL